LETNPKNHGREINDEESWRKNRWKRNHREGIIEERSICEASGRHLGGISEASQRYRKASGRHHGLQEAMGLQEAPNPKKSLPLLPRMQKLN
jgi:hypothetical protein